MILQAVRRAQSIVHPVVTQIAAPVATLDPDAILARNRFAMRYLKLASQALRWRTYAKSAPIPGSGGVSIEAFTARDLVGAVIWPVVEAGWTTGGRDVAERVLALFPAEGSPSLPVALVRRLQDE